MYYYNVALVTEMHTLPCNLIHTVQLTSVISSNNSTIY